MFGQIRVFLDYLHGGMGVLEMGALMKEKAQILRDRLVVEFRSREPLWSAWVSDFGEEECVDGVDLQVRLAHPLPSSGPFESLQVQLMLTLRLGALYIGPDLDTAAHIVQCYNSILHYFASHSIIITCHELDAFVSEVQG